MLVAVLDWTGLSLVYQFIYLFTTKTQYDVTYTHFL